LAPWKSRILGEPFQPSTTSGFATDRIPRRSAAKNTTWRRFLQAHWETLIAADFFATEVLSWNGLVTFYTLFVIDLQSGSVHVCGTTVSANAD
jgi:hypothetical protein